MIIRKALLALAVYFLVANLLVTSGMAYGDKMPVRLGKVAQGWQPQEWQYGLSAESQLREMATSSYCPECPPTTGHTTATATASAYAEASAFTVTTATASGAICTQPGCGNWRAGTIPSIPMMSVCLAPIQRNGIDANGIQLNYEAALVNILFERAFTTVFGQVADDIPTAYGDNHVVFEVPVVIESIAKTAMTMDDLNMRAVAATACANQRGQTLAVAIAGSGKTVVADGNQILDTQRVIIIDSQGYKYDLNFTRAGSDFWRVEVRC